MTTTKQRPQPEVADAEPDVWWRADDLDAGLWADAEPYAETLSPSHAPKGTDPHVQYRAEPS